MHRLSIFSLVVLVGCGGRVATASTDAATSWDSAAVADSTWDSLLDVQTSMDTTTDALAEADVPPLRDGPSCSGGLNCASGISCCAASVLPSGNFTMGRANNGPENDACWTWTPNGTCPANEQPAHEVSLSSFGLDAYEVTVGRFRKFVAGYPGNRPSVGAGANPKIAGSGWDALWNSKLPVDRSALMTAVQCDPTFQTWTPAVGPNEQKPINCVDWYTAFAFCAWDGGRLPTEAEWEYAAKAGSEARVWPWGFAPPSPSLASYGCLFDGDPACSAADLPAVGSTPMGVSKWGQQDLAGSVFEWMADAEGWYPYTTATATDPGVVSPALGGLSRGGEFRHSPFFMRATFRAMSSDDYRSAGLGVRCARNP